MWQRVVAFISLFVISVNCNDLYGSFNVTDLKFLDDNNTAINRVVNGAEARTGQFPWHALIYIRHRNNQWTFCSGALISNAAVLTEAGCLLHNIETRVFLGSTRFGGGHVVSGAQFITHPWFVSHGAGYNLAILRLARPVPLSRVIQPIGLPPLRYEHFSFPNQAVRFAGFGSASQTQPHRTLRWTTFRTVAGPLCTVRFPEIETTQVLCTQNPHHNINIHPGFGDAGSALVWSDGTRTYLIGLFAFSGGTENLFNGGLAGYINIPANVRWITRALATMPPSRP